MTLTCDSLDGTAEYLDGFAAAAPVRVEVARVPADPPSGPGRKEDTISIRGDFIAFVNNDTILTQGWLESLIAAVLGVPEAGMAAPMSNNAAGQLHARRPAAGLGRSFSGPMMAARRGTSPGRRRGSRRPRRRAFLGNAWPTWFYSPIAFR